MCNPWCRKFVQNSLPDWPQRPEVLEVGSRNVNGSVREFCAPLAARYVGCDLEAGAGVDKIADVTKLSSVFPPESFDVVISTEMMEHVPGWPTAWAELLAVLRPGGLLILSTRSPGFPLHDFPGDVWRFTGADIRRILEDAGDILRMNDDDTLGYACGVGVVARKRAGVDLARWREWLEREVPLYNMQACGALTHAEFTAGIAAAGALGPLRQRVTELEQRVFDAQIEVLRSQNVAAQLTAHETLLMAEHEEELARVAVRIRALENSLLAWRNSLFGRIARVADYGWELACLPVRAGRYLADPKLRAQALNSLGRRWQARRGRKIAELPELAWLFRKLDFDVPVGQVIALLGPYLTLRDEARYRAMIGPLIAAGAGAPSKVLRALDQAQTLPPASRRILFVCGEFPNPQHGGGGRVADFIKVLSVHHDVYVAAWYDRRRDHDAFVALASYCRRLRGLSFEDLEGGCAGKLLDLLGGQPADIVHYEWPRSLISLDRCLGRHHIYTHMESVSCSLWMDLHRLEPLAPEWLKRLAQLLSMLGVEALDANRADAQVVVTAKDGEFLSRFAAGQTYYVVNHGINREEFDLPDRAPQPSTLVFTGNFVHYPNVDAVHYFMREIRPLILCAVPELRLWLVGANPPCELQRYHDGRAVTVTGRVPDVRPYIQKAAVCIAPLISGAGLRTKVVQYSALRRPCVATPIAVEDLGFEDGREIFIANGPAAFAARVVELLRDPARAVKMAGQARARALACYDNRLIAEQGLGNLYRLLDLGKGQA